MVKLYDLRFAELPEHRADFFAWAVGAAWTSWRNRAPISREHWRLIARSMTSMAAPGLFDVALWILQNWSAMAR